MRRDWDLIRQILLKLEQKDNAGGAVDPSEFPGYDDGTVILHMRLLDQAGLIDVHPNTPVFCLARNLTWPGHELLDAIRTDRALSRISGLAKEKGLDLSFEAITAIARQLLYTQLRQEELPNHSTDLPAGYKFEPLYRLCPRCGWDLRQQPEEAKGDQPRSQE